VAERQATEVVEHGLVTVAHLLLEVLVIPNIRSFERRAVDDIIDRALL
jgi:hypothetical protein